MRIPVAAATAALAIFLAGCVKEKPMDAPPKPKPAPAPEFKLSSLEGKEVSLKDFAGKPVIINFWATWCVPCIKEMPELESFWHKKRADGLELLMINLKESRDVVSGFIWKSNFTFKVLLDETGKTSEDFQVFGLPCTYFVDRKGVIVDRHMGSLTSEILHAGFKAIVN